MPVASDRIRMRAMTQRLDVIEDQAPTLPVTIALVGTVATGTTIAAHGYLSTDYVTLATDVAGYNGKKKVTVLTPTTFTFSAVAMTTSPATGTVTYLSDAQGGRRAFVRPVCTIYGEMVPQNAAERLQRESVQSSVDYRFRVWDRSDVTAKMQARWSPTWGGSQRTLEITGVYPFEEGGSYMYLEATEVG